MIHLGDITKINGAEIPPVDVITGGSPCQDLSVAGKRAGLDGERSGLFMEQIRIIKEMRDATANDYRGPLPRYMVWENVPGAFSSGTPKGEDFRIVLEETAKVADQTAVIPRPEGGRWSKAGAIVGDGWSIAWRVHDAQFWGVPQRRKRIALVADFRGASAPEILFERQGLRGHSEPSEQEGERTAPGTEGSLGSASWTLKIRGGCEIDSSGKKAGKGALVQTEKAGTVAAVQDQTLIQSFGISSFASNAMTSQNPHSGIYEADTARTLDNNGGNPACNQGGLAIVTPIEGNGARDSHRGEGYGKAGDPSFTLNAVERHAVAVDARNGTEADVNASLQASASHNINSNNLVRVK